MMLAVLALVAALSGVCGQTNVHWDAFAGGGNEPVEEPLARHYCEIYHPTIDRKITTRVGEAVMVSVRVAFSSDGWNGEHIPYSVRAFSDKDPSTPLFIKHHKQILHDSSLFASFALKAIHPGEQQITCEVAYENNQWLPDTGDHFILDVMSANAAQFAHLIYSTEMIDVSHHCSDNTVVILVVMGGGARAPEEDSTDCWYYIPSHTTSVATAWNLLKEEATKMAAVKYLIFFDGSAVLKSNVYPEYPAHHVLHEYLSSSLPAIGTVRSQNRGGHTELPVVVPVVFSTAVVAIDVHAAKGLFPIETRWCDIDSRLAFVPLWIVGATVFKGSVHEYQELYVEERPAIVVDGTWMGGSLRGGDSEVPWHTAVAWMQTAVMDSTTMLIEWGSENATAPFGFIPEHPLQVRMEFDSAYFNPIVDNCHPYFILKLGRVIYCEFTYHEKYQHYRREMVFARSTMGDFRELQSRSDVVKSKVEHLQKIAGELLQQRKEKQLSAE